MKEFAMALSTEITKAVKSKVFTGTIIFSVFVALMIGVLFYIVKNPEMAQASAIIRAKATIIGNADWKTFFNIMNLMIAVIGMFSFGFIMSWIFGREYADKTLKDIIALPVSGHYIIIAKYVVNFFWSLIISFLLLIVSLVMGYIIGLENWSSSYLITNLGRYFIIVLMNIVLCPVISFLASWGRGYILPLGFIFLTILVSSFAINISENARYIPWAVPLLYAGAVLKEGMDINTASLIVMIITGMAGFAGTIYWWRYADQY